LRHLNRFWSGADSASINTSTSSNRCFRRGNYGDQDLEAQAVTAADAPPPSTAAALAAASDRGGVSAAVANTLN
jgi:hypothetical protein